MTKNIFGNMTNQAIEDYLKTIFDLEGASGKVTNADIARKLDITPASVTGMIKKLADLNLLSYQPYQGVKLTGSGRKIALEVLRHHRLIELFLAEALGVPWDKVHEEAEKWEHVLSDELEERIDKLLGRPTHDPHGSPIPDRNGKMVKRSLMLLSELSIGVAAEIAEVPDEDSELLRYLGDLGLYPGTAFQITSIAPFDGPLTIHLAEHEHVLGRKIAEKILVREASS